MHIESNGRHLLQTATPLANFSMCRLEWAALNYRTMQPRDNWSMQSRGGGCMSSAVAEAAAHKRRKINMDVAEAAKRAPWRNRSLPFAHHSGLWRHRPHLRHLQFIQLISTDWAVISFLFFLSMILWIDWIFFLAWTRLSNNYFTIIDDKIWDKNQFENCSSRFRWFERFQVFQNPIFTSNEMLNLFPDYFTESQLGNYSKWLNTFAVNATIYLPVFFFYGFIGYGTDNLDLKTPYDGHCQFTEVLLSSDWCVHLVSTGDKSLAKRITSLQFRWPYNCH